MAFQSYILLLHGIVMCNSLHILQVYWNYVKHMLTNLGTLTLDRIYSMMGMFGMQETTKKTLGLNELRAFLTKKTQKQELVYNNGYYSLP